MNLIHIIAIILIAINFSAGFFVPAEQQVLVWVSSFGLLALLSLMFTLLIPTIRKKWKGLTGKGRVIGLWTFVFVIIHVTLVFNFLFQWDIFKVIENPFRILGLVAFFILLTMALTSNKTSVRKLGRKWKWLHRLAYVALLLLILHSFNVGAIFMKNDQVRGIVAGLFFVVIVSRLVRKKL